MEQLQNLERAMPDMTGNEYAVCLDTLGIGFGRLLLDEDLTVLWANHPFYSQTGYTKEEYGSAFRGLRHQFSQFPQDFDLFKHTIFNALEQKKPRFQSISRMPVKGGGFIWVHISGTVTDEVLNGFHVALVSSSEISDLLLPYEQKMQYFEWMMEVYAGNIYISDMDTYELLYLNKISCQTLHMKKEELLGRKCYEVIQGRSEPCPFCTNSLLTRDQFYEWEYFNPILNRTFMIKNRMIDWEGHRARIELSHDMYSVEYKLAKKDQEREALIRTIPGGLARLDARDFSTVLWYAADFLDMIGYTAEQFENELHSQCTYIHPDDLERVLSIIRPIRETGQHTVFEVRLIKRSGEQRIVTITLCYVGGEDSWDGIPSFYSIGLDVTEERAEQGRQRKALEEAYQTARISNSAKTDFLSSMSHDIRTPMNAIVGMTAIARANLNSPERVSDCLNKINTSSRHLLSLINEVLDMSKIESGKVDLAPENIDLPELIQSVSVMCKPLQAEKNQELKIIVGQVQHEKLIADGDRLQQVFMNLLSNAIKYSPDGGKISLMINEKPFLTERMGQFEFVFTDNGIGMSSDYLPHLFEPFTRAEDSRISKIQGTGLGMAITENIVQMMNGTIDVKSQLGKGSRFTVTVPLQLQLEDEKHGEELVGHPVLVVDDDQAVCENAAMLLNELGMRGSWVLSGAEAIQRVADAHKRRDDYFAVILDWKMPGMDGLETVKAIRSRLGDDVPIIIISAYDYSDIEDEFVRAGADAFITKPLFKSKMLHVLQLFCSSSKLETANTAIEKAHFDMGEKRVLLAEDNELNREIAIELLQMQNILVDAAENGARAVELFRQSAPGSYAAILMDIQMPVMDGYAATSAIRALDRPDAQTVPILALTANAFVADIGKARSVGMNDHISKPIDIDHLITVLREWIQ